MIQFLSKDELGALKSLLENESLPTEDIYSAQWFRVVGIYEGEVLAAAGGLELCGESLLLRSVVTQHDFRGRGLASEVLQALHDAAKETGYPSCWLLTTDAERYFSGRHGYQTVKREDVAVGIQGSAQLTRLCPDSATVMRRRF